MATTPPPRYIIQTLSPSSTTHSIFTTLTHLSLLAIQSNPLHYLAFRPKAQILYEEIFEYHLKTRIELLGLGNDAEDEDEDDGNEGSRGNRGERRKVKMVVALDRFPEREEGVREGLRNGELEEGWWDEEVAEAENTGREVRGRKWDRDDSGQKGEDEEAKYGEGEEEKGKIIGFATWVFSPKWPEPEVETSRPPGMDMRFLTAFREKTSKLVKELDLDGREGGDCIELHLMRVHPLYQGRGIGSLLLNWRLALAREQRRKIYLLASPQGKGLYLKWGFRVLGEVRLRIGDYLDEEEGLDLDRESGRDGEEVYVQSLMVWDGFVDESER